jgi:hypothetical protein
VQVRGAPPQAEQAGDLVFAALAGARRVGGDLVERPLSLVQPAILSKTSSVPNRPVSESSVLI